MTKPTNSIVIAAMQKAVDVVNTSHHPENKIAATLSGQDHNSAPFSISHTNYWPAPIAATIGTDTKIGNSSGTIHAETACILAAPATYNAHLCITDPFCPNCAKNIAEAGITNIYIDHKGLDKDWIKRNRESFEDMSLRICARAGINVYAVNRKTETIEALYEVPADYSPLHENPVEIIPADTNDFSAMIHQARRRHDGHQFAVALAEDIHGKPFTITARRHAAIGYSRDAPDGMENKQGKYSFIVQPVTRLLMGAPRKGLKIKDGMTFSTRVPTSRELVNMIGAGLTSLHIGDLASARDDYAFKAMEKLAQGNIMRFTHHP